ncbi:MAG: FKBP-type peptidyl-prolyl cis-trans isomerase [Terracidiphilus sp.]|jgi:peptidylprolyl isomerase
MKYTALILLLAVSTAAACAQTPAKPATAARPAATAAAKTTSVTSPTIAAVIKAPAGIPVVKGFQKTIFTVALRYQDIKIGTGAVAEPNKLYKVLYTGWRASDGVKFDSSDDHRVPLKDKDGKPVLGDDGKPKLGEPQPMPFPQGMGGTIVGFDQGFAGMRIGGIRRIFIPWQMAYGTRAIPDHGPDHPGIPAKSDLIFNVELVEVTEMPQMPPHPPMGGMHQMPGMSPHPPMPASPAAPGAAPKPPAPAAAPAPATTPNAAPAPAAPATTPAAPATPATPAQPPAK